MANAIARPGSARRRRPFTRSHESRRASSAIQARLQLEELEARCLLTMVTAGHVTLGPLVQMGIPTPFAGSNDGALPNAEVEPAIAADPNNPKHLVSVWQQDRFEDRGARAILAAASFDGGNTWSVTPIPGLTVATGGPYDRASDPVVAIGGNGVVYVTELGLDANLPNDGVFVSESLDGGRTFAGPIALRTDADFNVLNDKEWITADPNNPRTAYVSWDRIQFDPNTGNTQQAAWFSKTTDGGRTWSTAQLIFDPGPSGAVLGTQIVVLPNGTLVDSFALFDFSSFVIDGAVLRSTNGGATWSSPIITGVQESAFTFTPSGQIVRDDGLPDIAVDHRNGNLYLVYESGIPSGFQINEIDMQTSTDGGLTWSAPIKVNQTPTNIPLANQEAFIPAVAVAANGTVGVLYYDFRNPDNGFAGGTGLADEWMAFGRPNTDLTNPANWGSEVRMTTQSFDMTLTAFTNQGFFVGDYQGLTAGGQSANSFSAAFGMSNPAQGFFSTIFFRDPGGDGGEGSSTTSEAALAGPELGPQSASPTGLRPSSSVGVFNASQSNASTRWDAANSDLVFASVSDHRTGTDNDHAAPILTGGTEDSSSAADSDSWTWNAPSL